MVNAKELHERVTNLQNEKIKAAEQKIDVELEQKYDGEHADVNPPEGLTGPQITALKQAYIRHGWNIKEIGEQRDGYSWRFRLQEISGNMNDR